MTDHSVHFPKTFLCSDSVRALARMLGALPETAPVAVLCPADFYVYRLWMDWGRVGTVLRAFIHPGTAQDLLPLNADPLCQNIEQWCDWQGAPGALVEACLAAGVLRRAPGGLELAEFGEHNGHLAPGFVGQHAKGGKARGLSKRLASVMTLVPRQLQLVTAAGVGGLGGSDVTHDERLQALGFVMGMDGARGLDPRRPQDYPPELLRAAIEVVRRHSQEKLGKLLIEIAENFGNPAFVTDPEMIIRRLLG